MGKKCSTNCNCYGKIGSCSVLLVISSSTWPNVSSTPICGFLQDVASLYWVTTVWLATVHSKIDRWSLHAYWYICRTKESTSAPEPTSAWHHDSKVLQFMKKIIFEKVWIIFFRLHFFSQFKASAALTEWDPSFTLNTFTWSPPWNMLNGTKTN